MKKVIAVMCCMIFLCGCNDLIQTKTIDEFVSPDGKYKAIKFSVDGGATTSVSYHLSILPVKESSKVTRGNVLVSYSNFDAQWNGSETLEITFYEDDEIFNKITSIYDINVVYKTRTK